MDIQTALRQGQTTLSVQTEVASLEAMILLSHTLGVNRSYLYTYPEALVADEALSTYQELLSKRSEGIPLAYLVGTQEFWSIELKVNAATLIPRPETEMLVAAALNIFPSDSFCKIADLGTGSGAIALALAKERPHWKLHAIDKELEALSVAKRNAEFHHIQNVQFFQGNWCDPLMESNYDAIISNPPYIAENDPHLANLIYEPHSALVSGRDGLMALTQIIIEARRYLKPNGWLLLEHGYNQKNAVMTLLEEHYYHSIESLIDLAGHPRIVIARCGR